LVVLLDFCLIARFGFRGAVLGFEFRLQVISSPQKESFYVEWNLLDSMAFHKPGVVCKSIAHLEVSASVTFSHIWKIYLVPLSSWLFT
jgi:hypothetical protein